MISNLFKLIWNRKRQNFLIMLELFVSFLIMFAAFTLIINYYQSYQRPAGFDYSNVWTINRVAGDNSAQQTLSRDSAVLRDQVIKQQVRHLRGVRQVSYTSNNTPYSGTRATVNLTYDKATVVADHFIGEDSYADVLGMQMHSGRWFSKEDDAANYSPAIVNEHLEKALFGEENALNKLIKFNNKNYKIVGVANDTKYASDYTDPRPAIFFRADSTFYGYNSPIIVKVDDGTDIALEAKLFKSVSGLMKNTSVEIVHLDDSRQVANKLELFPVILVVIVVLFFIVNVALGLFGVLWQNINKRRAEIGLRRAIGASQADILKQMVGETIILTTIAVFAGSFLAIQFPLLNVLDLPAGIYLLALLFAVIFIYIFVTACALYPARQAAAIYPRDALHDE